jgi:hypothetical protein
MSSALISVEMDEMDLKQTPAGGDTTTEAAVLQQLLFLHPAQVSFEELLREVAADPDEFGQRDEVERAVRDLGAAGLLRREGELVLPTLAALRSDELLG